MCRANTTYCCICGCPFTSLDIDPDVRGSLYAYDSNVVTTEDTEWLRRCTAFNQNTFFMAKDDGPRSVEGIDALLHHIESIENSRNANLNKFLRGSGLDGPVYALHNDCMAIAERVRRHQSFRSIYPEPTRSSVLQAFYTSLKHLHYRIASQSHSVRWEHGYYGAARFWRNFWGQERGWEWLVADPTHIPNLTDWVLSQLRPVSDDSTTTATPPPYTTTATTAPYPRPTLDGMPIDVLHRITAFLPPPATLRLRRTSKSLLNRLPLPQSFWRDALTSGTLIPFLWDLDEHACRQHNRGSALPLDWRSLARRLRCSHAFVQAALRKTLSGAAPVEGYGIGYLDFYASVAAQGGGEEDGRLVGAPPGLLNRCRIAQVVADVEAIEEEELLRDCHVPLSDEEEVYAAMWIVRVQRPEAFDEYRIRRSLELHGDLSEIAERESGRVVCRL